MIPKKEKNYNMASIIALILFLSLVDLQPAKADSIVKEIKFARIQKEKEILKIEQIKVLGSTVFSQKELDAVTNKFIGQEVNLQGKRKKIRG
jgi:hemolysin activation/secretion protein